VSNLRFSKLYAPTLKEAPADADIKSLELLIRGGFIRKVAAGVYTYLPLGFRVIKKIEEIVRQEMESIQCQETMMPIIQPAELWKTTGRWDDYGPEMMKLNDRHNRDFTLGPTHEEMITYIVKNELRSYKQLPISLYQIANKYRDEIRPRFGVLRAREFIMKDAYSFHASQESLDESYKDFYSAYERIVKRLGAAYSIVEADSGAIGGSGSHEFQVLAKTGESTIFYCDSCGYSATDEKATALTEFSSQNEEKKSIELKDTPNVKTIDQVANFLNVPLEKIVKSLLLKGRNGWILALIRGDYEINLSKIRAVFQDQTIDMGDPMDIKTTFGVEIGFIGPVGLKGPQIIADDSVKPLINFVVGGMEKDKHFVNANIGRDFNIDNYSDIRIVKAGENCPHCKKPLKQARGIEVGQVFKLGTKYSSSMQAYYTDETGNAHPYIMGCYGWGISRTMGAVVEQLHDENGILWPVSIAPYKIAVVPVSMSDAAMVQTAEKIYNALLEKNIDALLDDRTESPGFKFKDIDLIGIPLKIIAGKGVKEGKVEVKLRTEKQGFMISIDNIDKIVDFAIEKLNSYNPTSILD